MRSVSVLLLCISLLAFQNCSDDVSFSHLPKASLGDNNSTDTPIDQEPPPPPPIVVCNPLDSSTHSLCPVSTSDEGLVGNLYYLTRGITDGLGKTLEQAVINDYIQHGVKTNALLKFNQVNITPRAWDSGFGSSEGALVKKDDGESLFEWFAIHLEGKIKLPQGDWQLAIISDDGMRVTIDGQILLEDDGIHAPRKLCAATSLSSDGNTKLPIDIKYFQGPRVQIAMQLVYREASRMGSVSCDQETDWKILEASAFSH